MKTYGIRIKNQIIDELKSISNLNLLSHIFEYLRDLKQNRLKHKSNRDAVLKFAGTISDEEAEEMLTITSQEFNSINRNW